ncbi:hypothetical protein [Labrys neptuniae]
MEAANLAIICVAIPARIRTTTITTIDDPGSGLALAIAATTTVAITVMAIEPFSIGRGAVAASVFFRT